ncbi:MAG: hypothetical protein PF487_13340 [Bacteroidales bacterium]|jgi:cell division protein FtsQ|nr:hypothetical protein [Bacteroidales bacterium]
MKVIKKILFWVVIISYFIVALSFVSTKSKEILCNKIDVVIIDSLKNKFINSDDINKQLINCDKNILGSPIVKINTKEIEELVNRNSSIKNSQEIVSNIGELKVEINQRYPIMRIINKNGDSYYIDNEGYIMPLSKKYTSHVILASGYITEYFEIGKLNKIDLNNRNEIKEKNLLIYDLFKLGTYINKKKLWNSQFEQIYVNNYGEFEIIPRVGAHIIYFGSIDNYKEKLRNLKAFYYQGLNNVGWNDYEKINLKFKNQVICTKR